MRIRQTVLALAAACVLVVSGHVWAAASDAAASSAEGQALLQKGDFAGALQAYAKAAKADSENQEYRTQYMVLRRVITLRDGLAKEKNAEKWELTARSLRNFYHMNKLYGEALPLDREMHAKANTADSAIGLAETLLALDKSADAEKLLGGLEAKVITNHTRILQGVAQARQNKVDPAKELLKGVKLTKEEEANPNVLFDLATLKSLTGDTAGGLVAITACFENVPPSQLEAVKKYAKDCKDLSAVTGSADFATALKAESKVKESKCSGGANCGTCKNAGSCSTGAKGAAACKEEAKTGDSGKDKK
ncbi:MAG TPA: hypothetical protein PKY77_07720 [Phycisphaerae bacterium]|nr:hypothetical protein [Phycisphaerae bacterium]HRY66550.1 hypothetical protein [Phycisphaerae bacterium]HSA26970.1 hypothetical protein [Phycisphaerae bacterium]